MNLQEYKTVENLTYLGFCDYLQKKYGISPVPYFTKNWNKNTKVSRTRDGLTVHHKYEDHAIMLGHPNWAQKNPYEWQLPENLVYCDYLEHLFLHILICEYPSKDHNENEIVGIGGVINFLVPELNDLYSGWKTKLAWQAKCHERVIHDKDVYLLLLKRFKKNCSNYPFYTADCLYKSFNESYGLWKREWNQDLFDEIKAL